MQPTWPVKSLEYLKIPYKYDGEYLCNDLWQAKGWGDNVGYGTLEVEIKAHSHSKYESQDI